jgi:hypothetical protein
MDYLDAFDFVFCSSVKSTVAAVSHYTAYKAPCNYKKASFLHGLLLQLSLVQRLLDVIPPPQTAFSSGNCYQLADEPKYCNGTEEGQRA